MSRRLGNHRVRPARSEANRARPDLDRLNRELAAAKARGNTAAVAVLENQIAWALVNSLTR